MTTPCFARFDSRQPGTWYNAALNWGYDLFNERIIKGWFGRCKVIYDYCPIYERPMYYQLADGTRITAGPFDDYDGGSVPIPLQRWLPHDGSHSYILHDYSYKTGGLLVQYPGESTFTFRQVTRAQADMLLRMSAQNDTKLPMTPRRAKWVWIGVCSWRWFSPGLFHAWQPMDAVPLWPSDEKPDVDDCLPMGIGA